MKEEKYYLPENQAPWLEDAYLKHFGFKADGFFVELGVGHVFYQEWDQGNRGGQLCSSNTGPLADMGWKGILVEPHPFYYEECKRRHKKNNVKIVNCAAGAESAERTLGLGDTLRADVQLNFRDLGWLTELQRSYDYPDNTFKVQEKNVMSILEEQNCPQKFDLLSVDVEGYERIIFGALDLTIYRPKLITVELRTNDKRFYESFRRESQEVEDLIINQGYKKIYSDILNGLFLLDE